MPSSANDNLPTAPSSSAGSPQQGDAHAPGTDGPAEIALDLCGLSPPEPMERVLEALAQLAPGQRIRMLIDREPRPLYRILDNNGYRYRATERSDFLYDILIWEKP
jgi:uncharacterized protein (DUF2249 family)